MSWLNGAVLLMSLYVAGCGRQEPQVQAPRRLDVDVFADTGRSGALAVVPPDETPRAAVWLDRVTPVRIAPSSGSLGTPAPEAAPETLASEQGTPPALPVDENLKPPLLRERGTLTIPRGAPREAVVELDVRVDEQGRVSDALWAAGSEDSALVRAATDCALAMTFYPALQAGRPVPVWCRQRFDFGASEP